MKKRISLLLCVLVLLLFAQSACALSISAIHNVSLGSLNVKSLSGNSSSLKGISTQLGSQLPEPSVFEKHLDKPFSGSVIRKAIVTDLTVTKNDHPVDDASGFGISVPMNEIAGEGTIVQNVHVLHGTRSLLNGGSGDDEYEWAELQSALTLGEPSISYNPGAGVSPSPDADTTTGSPSTSPSSSPSDDPDSTPSSDVNDYQIDGAIPKNAPSVVRSNLNLVFLTQSCSPFIIVWDEIPLYSDVPQTGDSSSSMTWFVLLAASCAALLVLRRRVRRA